jgi:hypothetical protein
LNLKEVKQTGSIGPITTKKMKEKKGTCLVGETYLHHIGLGREVRTDKVRGLDGVATVRGDEDTRRVS